MEYIKYNLFSLFSPPLLYLTRVNAATDCGFLFCKDKQEMDKSKLVHSFIAGLAAFQEGVCKPPEVTLLDLASFLYMLRYPIINLITNLTH